MCGQVASYYRLAVTRNRGNVPAIIEAINAIPLHLSANDDNAEENHNIYPMFADTWCRYNAAKYTKEPIPNPSELSER